jgi:SAM-dependent methyltransferase
MDRSVYSRMAEIEDRHWWFVARRQILAAAIARLGLPEGARILEAGSGTGGNLAMLSGFGDVVGIEPDDEARACAAAKPGPAGGFDVRPGALPDDLPVDPASFDLIAGFDVVEHLDDDVGCLRALLACLRPGGRAIFTVPAFAFLWSRHDELHHHKRRYVRSGLQAALEAAGFRDVRITYFNTMLFPLIATVRLIRNAAMPGRGASDDAMPPAAVNRVLQALFASERHWVGRVPMPAGVSLLAVARRVEDETGAE